MLCGDKLYSENSFEQLIAAARGGDTDSKIQVAMMYMHGVGITQDFDKAQYWFKSSANDGHPQGLKMYGYTFYGTSNKQAFEYINKAAQLGDIEARYPTSKFYLEGLGVRKNKSKSIYWYNKAIEAEI